MGAGPQGQGHGHRATGAGPQGQDHEGRTMGAGPQGQDHQGGTMGAGPQGQACDIPVTPQLSPPGPSNTGQPLTFLL